MDKKTLLIFTFLSFCFWGVAQEELTIPAISAITDTTKIIEPDTIPESEIPEIIYTFTPKKYKIQDIKVVGATNADDFALIAFSGLSIGDVINIPGEDITDATRRFWRQGLYSDVQILASRMVDDKVWLEIRIKERPRIYEVKINGVKKGDRAELEKKLHLRSGHQFSIHIVDRAKTLIKKYFEEKGYKNVDVDIVETPAPERDNEVIVNINIDRNEKTKIQQIHFEGNEMLTDFQLRKAMKKTNERFNMIERFSNSWMELFSTKKFTQAEFENDKRNLIDKYNEYGYRDAIIVADSVVSFNNKRVSVYLTVEEGKKYYLKDFRFVGNTKYPSEYLTRVLNIKQGEVYNTKKLMDRIYNDEDALRNIYMNTGYMFTMADPVEVEIDGDSISLEIRINEGVQATINKVIISGNDRLYEDVIRRELRTKPGDLFSREALMRSLREIAQTGHFDPENLQPDFTPNQESGTVDIIYPLTSKPNDQFEFSLGWGQTGLIGRVGFSFKNFALSNILRPSTYSKGVIPQGEGQTFSVNGQTNASYYQAYSVSFMDPWFGGKRPNTLSVSAYFSRYTGVNNRYYSEMQSRYYDAMYQQYMNSMMGGYSGYTGYENYYESAYDKNKYMQILGFSVGYGKRLKWPDDWFVLMGSVNYQMYMLNNWENSYYLGVSENGNYNDINLELSLSRSSTDNPLYTRSGSEFLLTGTTTLPYSMFDGKDYSKITSDKEKYKFIEYYKLKFKSKMFIPLARLPQNDGKQRTPVLMSRVEVGWIGDYNKNKRSPFGTFYVGGDGMTGGYSYNQETVALRGYSNGEIAGNNMSMPSASAYSRISLELRYPLILEPSSTIYGLVFGEAGDAWTRMSDFSPFNLKRSAGAGVRIFLPMIGLMGIDWAYGFDRPFGSGQRGGSNFHFILGQEF